MVQNGQLSENNWKTDYFSATKEQKKMTALKNEIKWLEGSGFDCPTKCYSEI